MFAIRIPLRLLCLTTLLILAEISSDPFQARAASTTIAFDPASSHVLPGHTVDVTVKVQDVAGLYGVDLAFTFDPAILEVVDADPATGGIQVAQAAFLETGFVVVNTADNGSGNVHFAMTQLNPSEAKSGTGALIIVRLKGKQAGVSPLTLIQVQLASRDGTPILATSIPGEVEVVNTNPAPTATALPATAEGTILPSPSYLPADTSTPTQPPASPTTEMTAPVAETQTTVPPASSPKATILPSPTSGSPLPGTLMEPPASPSAILIPPTAQEPVVPPETDLFPNRTALLAGLGGMAALIALIGIIWCLRKLRIHNDSHKGGR